MRLTNNESQKRQNFQKSSHVKWLTFNFKI